MIRQCLVSSDNLELQESAIHHLRLDSVVSILLLLLCIDLTLMFALRPCQYVLHAVVVSALIVMHVYDFFFICVTGYCLLVLIPLEINKSRQKMSYIRFRLG